MSDKQERAREFARARWKLLTKVGQVRRAISYNRTFFVGGILEESATLANDQYNRMLTYLLGQLERLGKQQKAELNGTSNLRLPVRSGLSGSSEEHFD